MFVTDTGDCCDQPRLWGRRWSVAMATSTPGWGRARDPLLQQAQHAQVGEGRDPGRPVHHLSRPLLQPQPPRAEGRVPRYVLSHSLSRTLSLSLAVSLSCSRSQSRCRSLSLSLSLALSLSHSHAHSLPLSCSRSVSLSPLSPSLSRCHALFLSLYLLFISLVFILSIIY